MENSGSLQKWISVSKYVSESLGRLIVQTFTTDISNHLQLIDFPMCTECKKEGQKPIKKLKTKD